MRFLEIILAIATILVIFSLISNKIIGFRKIFIFSGFNILVLLSHLLLEGYRWQLIPIYLISVGLFIAIIFKFAYKKVQIRNKVFIIVRNLVYLILISFTFASVSMAAILPVFKMPKPTGSLPVGTQIMHFVDETRKETFTKDTNDKRELMVQIWYPAQNIAGKKPLQLMPDGNAFFVESLREDTVKNEKASRFISDYLKYVKSHSYENAEVSDASNTYPMILLSHGLAMSRLMYISQAENLASQGYIVVGIDYTYYAAATKFPDGRIACFDMSTLPSDDKKDYEHMGKVCEVLQKDGEYIIDQFTKINNGEIDGILKGKIDLKNIGALGHSMGGGLSYELCYSDSRIKAGVDLDGLIYNVDNVKGLNKPFLFFYADLSMKKNKMITNHQVPDQMQNMNEKDQEYMLNIYKHIYETMDETVKNGGYIIHIKGSEHNNYTDLPLFTPMANAMGLAGTINGKRGSGIINRYVLEFFDKYLKGKDSELLSNPSSEYPEVELIKSL